MSTKNRGENNNIKGQSTLSLVHGTTRIGKSKNAVSKMKHRRS